MDKLEQLISNTFVYYNKPKKNCDSIFNSFKEIPTEDRFKESKLLKLNKNKKGVTYDSPFEKDVLEDLDKCSFIKKIKTQSLIIEYKSNNSNKVRKYYPDIQLLLNDGSIVIIEIKPFKEMVNKRNIKKHEALKEYCKKNRYGYTIIDNEYYSFENLKKEKVPLLIQHKFIKFVKDKKEVTFDECASFKKDYNLDDYQICYIIYKNRNKHLTYQQHLISYRKE